MSSRFFERNADVLAAAHRVVTADFRGHGESPPADGGHTLPRYAQDVRTLIEALGLRDAIAVGWSMGALVIWEYLRQFSKDPRIAGVVVVSQGPSDLRQPGWPFGIADIGELHHYVEAMQNDFHAFFDAFVPSMFKNPLPVKNRAAFVAETQLIEANAGSLILLDQTLRDYRDLIPQLALPHLLVWGRDEKVIQLGSGEWLKDHLQAAELVVFDDSGHCPMWEEPTRFNQLLTTWSKNLPA